MIITDFTYSGQAFAWQIKDAAILAKTGQLVIICSLFPAYEF